MAGNIDIGGLFDGLFDIGKELITDKDKLVEYTYKTAELKSKASIAIINMKTTPKVDAFVKVLYAFKDVGKELFRPVGSFCMAIFAGYMKIYHPEIDLTAPIEGMLFGAPVAWGYSRHVGQNKK